MLPELDQILPSLSPMHIMASTMAKPKAKKHPGFRKTWLGPFVEIAMDDRLEGRGPAFARAREEAIRLVILTVTQAYRASNAVMRDAVQALEVNWRTIDRWREKVPGLRERIEQIDEEAVRDGWMGKKRHAAGNSGEE